MLNIYPWLSDHHHHNAALKVARENVQRGIFHRLLKPSLLRAEPKPKLVSLSLYSLSDPNHGCYGSTHTLLHDRRLLLREQKANPKLFNMI